MRKSTAPNLVLLAGVILSVAGPGCRRGGDLASAPPYEEAFQRAPGLQDGLSVRDGKIHCKVVAEAHGLDYTPFAP